MAKSDDWHDSEFVLSHVKDAADWAASMIRSSLYEDMPTFQVLCESPIEAIFVMWWVAVRRFVRATFVPHPQRFMWTLRFQQRVTARGHKYRLDMVIEHDDTARTQRLEGLGFRGGKIAIELDGHEFHERTREQVTLRNKRDRDLAAEGWRVIHFSGSELVRRRHECAWEVLECGAAVFDAGEKYLKERASGAE
jgi:hypothetical protein